MTAATKAWAIKAPDGVISIKHLYKRKADLIDFIGDTLYNNLIEDGYRCVRVTVQECKE